MARPKGSKNKPKSVPDNIIVPTETYTKEYMNQGGYKRTLIKCESFDFVNGSLVAFVPEKGDWNFKLVRPLKYKHAIPMYSWNSASVAWTTDEVLPAHDPAIESLWVGLGQDSKPEMLLIFFKDGENSNIIYYFQKEDGSQYWDEEDSYDYYE